MFSFSLQELETFQAGAMYGFTGESDGEEMGSIASLGMVYYAGSDGEWRQQ